MASENILEMAISSRKGKINSLESKLEPIRNQCLISANQKLEWKKTFLGKGQGGLKVKLGRIRPKMEGF